MPVEDDRSNDVKVPLWLRLGAYLLIGLGIFGEFSYNLAEGGGVAYTAGRTTPTIIGAFIALYCANKNARWAFEIDKNVNIGYVIGFIFGLVGLLGYWLYYKIKIKKYYSY